MSLKGHFYFPFPPSKNFIVFCGNWVEVKPGNGWTDDPLLKVKDYYPGIFKCIMQLKLMSSRNESLWEWLLY